MNYNKFEFLKLNRKGRRAVKTKHIARKEGKAGKAILFGLAAAFATTIITTGIIAWLIHKENISGNATIAGMGVQFLAAFMGCFTAFRRNRNLKVVGITAGAYFVCLLAVAVLAFDGVFIGIWRGIIAIILGAAIALLPGKGRDRNVKRHKKLLRSC